MPPKVKSKSKPIRLDPLSDQQDVPKSDIKNSQTIRKMEHELSMNESSIDGGSYLSKEKRKKVITYSKKNYQISQSLKEQIKREDISVAPSLIMSKIIEQQFVLLNEFVKSQPKFEEYMIILKNSLLKQMEQIYLSKVRIVQNNKLNEEEQKRYVIQKRISKVIVSVARSCENSIGWHKRRRARAKISYFKGKLDHFQDFRFIQIKNKIINLMTTISNQVDFDDIQFLLPRIERELCRRHAKRLLQRKRAIADLQNSYKKLQKAYIQIQERVVKIQTKYDKMQEVRNEQEERLTLLDYPNLIMSLQKFQLFAR